MIRPLEIAIMVVLVCLAAPRDGRAQLQQASLTAVVLDAARAPVAGASVSLTDPLGAELQRAVTDGTGRATFAAVAPGRYALTTLTSSAMPIVLPVMVTGALPVEITVRVPAALTDRVLVEGDSGLESSARGSLGGESIRRVPVRVPGRALQDVVATLPGWFTEDNGLLHVRGVDDGFLYVIDGVPVYERLDAISGIAPDVSSIGSINVITGYVPPEFGLKAGGVIEVRSATADQWSADADVSLGTDVARDFSASVGGRLSDRVAVRAGGSGAASERFLDPVHPDNLHNEGGQISTFGQLELAATGADRVTANWGAGRSTFDVPNNAEQDEAGQDQRQRLRQGSITATWQRSWSPSVVTQLAAYHRRTRSRLDGSPADTPLEAHASRTLNRTGVLFVGATQRGAHLLKSGLEWQRLSMDEIFRFLITDPDEADEAEFREEALAFTRDQPFAFAGSATPTLFSLFVQDAWQPLAQLTVNGGLRLDRSQLLLTRTHVSPRVGAAIRVSDDTLLRASLNRYFQPPQPEHLLLSSSPAARVLSSIVVGEAEGGAAIEPERQWAAELGVEHQAGRVRLDVSYWRRWMKNVADPNVFAGTTIIFPNSVAEGRAHGLEVRVEAPKWRGWSAYANAAFARVVQTGPINGGLFLEDEVEEIGPGVEFAPDHDQRFTGGGGVSWDHPRGAAVSLIARYETGTPVPIEEDELDELLEQPGAEMVDFEAGRVKPRTVVSLLFTAGLFRTASLTASAGLQVNNLFGARYAYNFGNPFSGTHFGAPRTVAVKLRLHFN
jgi:outer membrane receptor protein involved in Fe transport